MADIPFGNAFYRALQARLAKNPTYSQDYRMGKNSYDCSSLMNRGMQDIGIPGVNPAATTKDMNPKNRYMWDLGFVWVPKSQGLQPGDIAWRDGHTEFYVGGKRTLGAHSSTNGVSEYDLQGPNKFAGGWRYVGNRFLGGMGNIGDSQQNPSQLNQAQGLVDPAVQQAIADQQAYRPNITIQMPAYREEPRGFSRWAMSMPVQDYSGLVNQGTAQIMQMAQAAGQGLRLGRRTLV